METEFSLVKKGPSIIRILGVWFQKFWKSYLHYVITQIKKNLIAHCVNDIAFSVLFYKSFLRNAISTVSFRNVMCAQPFKNKTE